MAEDNGAVLGFALMQRRSPLLVELTDLYVRPDARSRGVASALVRAAISAQDGDAEYVNLKATAANGVARSVYQHWGFRDDLVVMVAPVEQLRQRLAPGRHATSFASVHVQTDDRALGGARRRRVRASHPLERHARGRAAERLDDRVRRCRPTATPMPCCASRASCRSGWAPW